MKITKWTPERDDLLRKLRMMPVTCQEMLARLNDGFEPKMSVKQMQKRAEQIGAYRLKRIVGDYNHCKNGPAEPPAAVHRAASNEFARAGHKAALRLQVVQIAVPVQRMGIMSGKPPDLDWMIETRAAMARQNRETTVAEVFVRGLV
jgi:hypothetical protein